MDQQIMSKAVSAFCKTPESFKKYFEAVGMELTDDVCQAIKADPSKAESILSQPLGEQNGQQVRLVDVVASIYEQYGNDINKDSQMFAKGGKLGYLLSKI